MVGHLLTHLPLKTLPCLFFFLVVIVVVTTRMFFASHLALMLASAGFQLVLLAKQTMSICLVI